MHFLEIVLILMVNTGLILIMQRFQNRELDQKIKVLKNDVQELEDLVTAIIEEFEEVAGTLEYKEKTDNEVTTSLPDASPQTNEAPSLEQPAVETGTTESRHQCILDLSCRGLSVEEIAKELGIGRGEVSLILGLYKRS